MGAKGDDQMCLTSGRHDWTYMEMHKAQPIDSCCGDGRTVRHLQLANTRPVADQECLLIFRIANSR